MACIYQPYRCKGIFEELIRHGKDIRAMGNARLAVIGEGTKKAHEGKRSAGRFCAVGI